MRQLKYAAAGMVVVLASLVSTFASAQTSYHPIDPCRAVDTRLMPAGPLANLETRTLDVGTPCGLPVDASAVSYNLTAVKPTTRGFMTLFPNGTTRPDSSSINFQDGVNLANGGVVSLGPNTQLDLFFQSPGSGTVHAIIDITGYFK